MSFGLVQAMFALRTPNELERAGVLCCCSVYMDGAAEADEPGYGPLRAWPGGLCVSRAIGDMDVGECIIAHPHIMQMQIPEEGARVVIASDGLWDCFSSRKVVKMARTKDTEQAGQRRTDRLHELRHDSVYHAASFAWHVAYVSHVMRD